MLFLRRHHHNNNKFQRQITSSSSSSSSSINNFIMTTINSMRFCSSSSSPRSLTVPQLKNLALGQIPPTGTWLKVADVARSLPDDFFDNLPDEYTGLRGLLEQCDAETEAAITFRMTSGFLEVSRLPARNSDSILKKSAAVREAVNAGKVRREDVFSSAPPPPPEGPLTQPSRKGGSASILEAAAVAAANEAKMKRQAAMAKEQRKQKHEDSIRLARERAEARKRERAQMHEKVNENAKRGVPIKSLDDAEELEVERAQLRSMTHFPINIVEAALDHRRLEILEERRAQRAALLANNSNGGNAVVKETPPELIEKYKQDDEELTIRREDLFEEELVRYVDDFVTWIEPAKGMIDLFHTTADPWKTLREVLNSTVSSSSSSSSSNENSNPNQSITDLLANFYISILLPFQLSHGPFDGEAKFGDFRAQEYDLYRLARFLSTTFFCSVSSLVESDVQDILQSPILQITASFPNHFEFIPQGKPVPDGDDVKPCSVDQIVKGAEDAGLLVVKVGKKIVTSTSTTAAANSSSLLTEKGEEGKGEDLDEKESSTTTTTTTKESLVQKQQQSFPSLQPLDFDKSDALGFVRYILPSEQFTTATKCSFVYRNAPFEELEKALLLVKRSSKHSVPPADLAPEDLGILRAYPTGPRRQSMKQELSRALNFKRFPKGNVFFDRNVLAHYIFDTIPPEEAVLFEAYKREFLGIRARNVAPMYGNFPTQYPHLFHAFQDDRGEWFLQRADSQNKVKVKDVSDISEEECILAVLAAKPKKIDPYRPFQASTATYKMTRMVQKAVKLKFGGINGLLKRNPQRFTVVSDGSTGATGAYFYFNEEITPEVCSRVGLKKKEDGTYEVLKDSTGSRASLTSSLSSNKEEDELKRRAEVEKEQEQPVERVRTKRVNHVESEKKAEKHIPVSASAIVGEDSQNLWDQYASEKNSDEDEEKKENAKEE